MSKRQIISNALLINTYMHYLAEIGKRSEENARGYVLAKDFRTEYGCKPQAGTLKELFVGGFIERLHGYPFAYRLTRPLTSIQLSELIMLVNPRKDSSTIKLLNQASCLPLSTLMDVVVPAVSVARRAEPYSFDFIIALTKCFCHKNYSTIETVKGRLGEFSYAHTYVIGAIGALYRSGLVSRKVGTGYLANKPFKEMTLKDITPAVTQNNTLLNTLLYMFRDNLLSQFV